MRIARTFINNFAHPSGFLGRVVAWRLDISNRQANQWTLSLLDLQPSDHVLEVGFGSGQTLKTISEKVTRGFIAGVDSSSTMFKIASKRNAKLLMQGRMEINLGEMESLPYKDNTFDKVFAVQVINYLTDPVKGCRELFRVTRMGGRVALFFEAKEKFQHIHDVIEGVYHPYDGVEIVAMLRQAGFSPAWMETKDFTVRRIHYRGVLALGEKHSDTPSPKADPLQGYDYVFHIKGHLPSDWSDWFEGLTISHHEEDDTLLSGKVADQAALHGILAKIRDLNLTLISMRQL